MKDRSQECVGCDWYRWLHCSMSGDRAVERLSVTGNGEICSLTEMTVQSDVFWSLLIFRKNLQPPPPPETPVNSDLPTLCHVPEDSNCRCGKWVSLNLWANDGRNKEQLCSTSHTQHSPSWEANSSTASLEIPRILCEAKVRYWIHNHSPPMAVLKQNKPIHAPSWRSILIVVFHWLLGPSCSYIYMCVRVCVVCVCVCVCVECVCVCVCVWCVCVCVCV